MDAEIEPDRDRSPLATVDAKLAALAKSSPAPPPWYEAWTELGTDPVMEDRIAVSQQIRRAGVLPEAASFWLVSYLVDELATRDADDFLGPYEDRLREIEQAHRLEDGGIWPPGAAPAGYDDLRTEYHKAWGEFFARKLEEFGEHEMARLFREDHERFEQLSEQGRQYFHGPGEVDDKVPAVWLHRLLEAVAECMTAESPMGPLSYRYGEAEGIWAVDVYPTPVELIGGAVDGEVVAPGFTLEVDELRDVFDRVESIVWYSLGSAHDEGPRLIVEGVHEHRNVLLQILAYAPADEEPGMKLDTR